MGVMDILRILGGLFLLSCLLSYFVTNESILWGYRPWFTRPAVVSQWLVSRHVLSPEYSITNSRLARSHLPQ